MDASGDRKMLRKLTELIKRKEPTAEEMRRKALRFLKRGKPHLALTLLEKSLELEPSSIEGHINAGVALYLMQKHEEALKHFQFAAALDPQNATALINLAATLDALGQIDEALSVLRKLVSLFPNMPDVHYNLAVALAKKGLKEEAVLELRIELERNPSHPHALKLLQRLIRR